LSISKKKGSHAVTELFPDMPCVPAGRL